MARSRFVEAKSQVFKRLFENRIRLRFWRLKRLAKKKDFWKVRDHSNMTRGLCEKAHAEGLFIEHGLAVLHSVVEKDIQAGCFLAASIIEVCGNDVELTRQSIRKIAPALLKGIQEKERQAEIVRAKLIQAMPIPSSADQEQIYQAKRAEIIRAKMNLVHVTDLEEVVLKACGDDTELKAECSANFLSIKSSVSNMVEGLGGLLGNVFTPSPARTIGRAVTPEKLKGATL